jgi:hypothetical protein
MATPVIGVVRIWDSTAVQNGGYVQYSSVNIGGTDVRRFRIENHGDSVLRLVSTANLTSGPCFAQVADPINPVEAGASTSFRIDFGGCSPGFHSATVTIATNDPVTPSFTFTIGGNVLPPPSPDIAVFRPNGNSAANGSLFEFATIPTGAQDIRRFRIDNAGTLPLNISNAGSIVSGVCFSQTETPLAQVAAGGSTYVSVRFSCGSGGSFSGAMSIQSDDPDTNPYTVALTGTATVPQVPDIAVFNPAGTAIAAGGAYAFGNVPVSSTDVRRFRIDNTGNAALNIGDPAALVWGDCFTQTETPVTPVAPGASSYVSVRFRCTAAGSYTANMIIPSDDPDESPYRITLSATATALPTPDIAVVNPANAAVATGGSYAFGSVTTGTSDTRRFRIDNSGNAGLNIGNGATLITGPCFAQTETPSTPVPPGGSTWFSVRFLCGAAGSYTGAVTIVSDDADESPYTINLTATAVAGNTPDIAVVRNWDQVAVANGGSAAFPGATGINQSNDQPFRIDNTGGAALTISNPATLVSGACFSQLDAAPSTIASGASAVVRVRLSCATAGTATGKITIQSNDPDESPYVVNLSATVAGNNAAVVSQNIPSTMAAGVQYDVSVTMKNTGGTTWTAAANDKLGIQPDAAAATWSSSGRVLLGAGESIAPGATKTFSFKLLAPGTPGTYSLQWRMVQELVEWFGDTTPLATVTVMSNDATFVRQTVPASMTAGTTYPVSVTLKNTGTSTWTSNGGYKLASATPGNPFGASIALPATVSVAPGATYVFSFNVTAPAAGNHAFQWRMQDSAGSFGAATPAVTVAVQAIPRPVVDSIEPQNIPAGASTYVTLYGSNLTGATVRFPPRASGKVTPTVQMISGSATRLTVLVNATNPTVDGFHGIFIENAGGRAAIELRVVPNRPVIDSYTPSEASFGDMYFIALSGANLDGAVVTSTAPSVQFVGLESTEDTLSGVLYVQPGSGNIDSEIVVSRPGGGSTSLPLALRDRTAVTKEMRVAGNSAGGNGVYIQEPVVLTEEDPAGGKKPPVRNVGEIDVSCDFSATRSHGHSGVITILQNPLTHVPDPNILSGMAAGETRLFESLIAIHSFSIVASITIHCDLENTEGDYIDVNFCLAVHASFEVVGVGGQTIDGEACFGSSTFAELHGSGFVNFAYRWGDGTGSTCSTIEDVSPDPEHGYREGRLTLNQCCSDPISVDSVFTMSDESGGGQREVHALIGRSTPKTDCSAPGCNFHVEIRAFIMGNNVLGAETCQLSQGGWTLYYQGDNRGFQPSPGFESSRIEQEFCAETGAGSLHSGLTHDFAPDALDRSVDPPVLLRAALDDQEENDCHYLEHKARAEPTETLAQILDSPPGVYRWHSIVTGKHPGSDFYVPNIDWDLEIEVDTNHHPAQVWVSGWHNGFPAYEVYVNDYQIYGWDSSNSNPYELFDILAGSKKEVDCTRQLGQAPCIAMDPKAGSF